ncbi:mitochondrial import inner membrane translocase subunit Tim9-like [Watersipora subatra]|uniref:mitochondrial import inner membrane translocase subunit Tim9-like n=1 Tax=Watersipora subatra TaxID=2589382 RepID=UPI00355BCC55
MVDHTVQFKDFMLMYNRITDNCFSSCVFDLNQRTLNNAEESCIHNCFFKHLNSNNRLMVIFSELQAKKQEDERIARERYEAAAAATNAQSGT